MYRVINLRTVYISYYLLCNQLISCIAGVTCPSFLIEACKWIGWHCFMLHALDT